MREKAPEYGAQAFGYRLNISSRCLRLLSHRAQVLI